MVAHGMIKEKKNALKPKVKSFKVRITRVNANAKKIRMEDQRCVGEEQRITGDELGLETQVIVKQSTSNRIRLGIVFNILGAREDDDVQIDADLGSFLSSFSDKTML